MSRDIAGRIEGRLERLELAPEQVDRAVGLPAGTVAGLLAGGPLPRGTPLRRLAEALGVDEHFLLGLDPGEAIPAEMLEEAQGSLGLLAPDEEALLRNYRRLEVPLRAAFNQILARAAGPEPVPAAPVRRRR
ncbi:hypothetical protein ACI6QG_02120 [Roseococcus sp. DSY-14]|uniref:hypothetical protein n=1 Tax=Roseococcus sp. DSY-14 TaxID=3369650 RepID=UPI00387A9040